MDMAIEVPHGHSHKDIWEREELFMRTKEFAQTRDALAPLYCGVATEHLKLPWQLLSYVDAEGFALRLRWSEHELPDPLDEQGEHAPTNIKRIAKALVKDLQTPYDSQTQSPPGWVCNEAMTLWVPEEA